MLTAMYYSPGGARRVIVLEKGLSLKDGKPATKIECDNEVGLVETALLHNYREEVI